MAKPNVFQYAQLFQQQLDKQVEALATSGWMEANAGQVKYNGGREVKIPIMHMDALGDYDRTDGFPDGSVHLEYQTKIMTQDRGRTFSLDSMDVDETNFVATAANVMGEFQRLHVIPEIDAYRYSSIASQAILKGSARGGYNPDPADVLSEIKNDIYAIYDVAGEIPLVITVSMPVWAVISNSAELMKVLNTVEFTKGDVKTKVRAIDENPIIPVPSARMKTEYQFFDGKTSGQEQGGFQATVDAIDINWIICPRTTPIAVSKTDKIRIFTPDQNQQADAWKIDYRKYHDLWIKDNQFAVIRVCTQ